MINESKPISMAESVEYLEKDSDIMQFTKKFKILKVKEAKELRKKLEELNLIKLDDRHNSKIIDLMPEKAEELNKIFVDIGLNEDETKKILDTVKEFK